METYNKPDTAQPGDITVELTGLVEAGWNEQQIARLARLRATYSTTSDGLAGVPANSLTRAEQQHLAFTSWLYHHGRLVS